MFCGLHIVLLQINLKLTDARHFLITECGKIENVIYEIEGNFEDFRATPLNGFVVVFLVTKISGLRPLMNLRLYFGNKR
jgi:hypothetical protein